VLAIVASTVTVTLVFVVPIAHAQDQEDPIAAE
jgi:hypothetical protein